jgi:PAS domain S-box-containing protein
MNKNTLIFTLILCFLAVLPWGSDASAPGSTGLKKTVPKAHRGVLDLRNWDFKKDGPIRLNGDWGFFWSRHLNPGKGDRQEHPEPGNFIRVPGTWNGYDQNGIKLNGDGYGTYTLKILLKRQDALLAFRFMDMATAFTFFANGKKIAGSGIPGETPRTSAPFYHPDVKPYFHTADEMNIICHVSNFHHWRGGMWKAVWLGTHHQIVSLQEKNRNLNLFLLGAIVTMAFYILGLYFVKTDDSAPLFFSLFSLLVSIRVLVTGDIYLVQFFPGIGWPFLMRVVYISFYLAILSFVCFTRSLFPGDVSKRVVGAVKWITLVFVFWVLVTGPRFFSYSMPVYQLMTIGLFIYGIILFRRALKQKRDGAPLYLLGFLVLISAGINDILYSREIIQTAYIIPVGLFGFMLTQSILIVKRFSAAFNTIDRQRKELAKTNVAYEKEILERQKINYELGESEGKYRALFEDSLDAMSLTQDGKIVDVNPAWIRLHGYTDKAEVFGIDILSFVHPEDRHIINERRSVKAETLERVYEIRDIRRDGTMLYVNVSSSSITIKGKLAILTTIHDVTNLKQAADEKRLLEAKLHRAEKMEALGTMAGGVAHDLNNILSGIVTYPDFLMMQLPDNSSLKEPLERIRTSGRKAAAIVQDLLTLARRGIAATEVLNLTETVSSYLTSFEYEKLILDHPEITVEVHQAESAVNIVGSPVHLSKTLMNLVSNAFESIKDSGVIVINTYMETIDGQKKRPVNLDEGHYGVLRVSDTGIGIADEDKKKIFEPFYTKKVMGRSGSGLGMAVVWGTVKDHKGHIDVKSDPGKGSVFTLYFPATHEMPANKKAAFSIDRYKGKGEAILVVDDLEEQRFILSEILKQLAYTVSVASNGSAALLHMKENKVDLVVLDMIMEPDMDGLETFLKIRDLYPGQKAIMASGYSESGRMEAAMRAGISGYVKKPYTLEKISIAVRAALDN